MNTQNLVLIILIFSLSYVSGQVDTLDERLSVHNCAKQPKDGFWVCTFSNGVIHREDNFKNGNFEGIQKSYFPNGQLKSLGTYSNGRLAGKYYTWDELGHQLSQLSYKNGYKEGEQTFWYTSGRIKRTEHYTTGIRSGIWKEWHKNGQLKNKIERSGWAILKDFGYWDEKGNEIENKIDRLIDSEKLRSERKTNIFTDIQSKPQKKIKELSINGDIDSLQTTFFHKIIDNRRSELGQRIEYLNYEYLLLTETYNIEKSNISISEEYCFSKKEKDIVCHGYVFTDYKQIGRFSENVCGENIFQNWEFNFFERIPPKPFYYLMGCQSPSKETQLDYELTKRKIDNEGEIIEPYYRIITLINGQTKEILISIQIPVYGKRGIEQIYGPG